MISGGALGSILGVYLFKYLSLIGRLEEVIAVAYIFFRSLRYIYAL